MSITYIEDAEAYFQSFVLHQSKKIPKNTTLQRIEPVLKRLGNPHTQLRVVHVAGTSGKTSTCYYAAALLHEAGYHVGCTISPHLTSITERVQINGNPISENLFSKYTEEFRQIVGHQYDISYPELLMVFALWVFAREEVSIAVVETGVGGLHDASNICQRSDKTCLITDIGYDHQLLLGNSLEDIATHKAGIIHKGNTVFTYRTRASIAHVFQRRAALVGAEIIYVDLDASQIDLPSYQARNWLLAKCAVDAILRKDLHPMLTATQVRRTQIAIPGRMQLVRVGSRRLLLDGAHNEQKMGAFVASYRKIYGDRRVPMLVAMKRGKDYSAMLRHLQPIAQQMWCTEITGAHLFPYRSLLAELLGEACRKEGIENIQVETDVSAALQRFIQLPDQMKIITGSLYLVGEVLDLLQKSKK